MMVPPTGEAARGYCGKAAAVPSSSVGWRWDEETAWRAGVLAIPVGFVVGATAGLVFATILIVRVLVPQRGWWVIGDGLGWLALSLMYGAAGGAVAAMTVVDMVSYAAGTHRCPVCGRRRWRRRLCECRPDLSGMERPSPGWQDRVLGSIRLHGPATIAIAIALLPATFGLVAWASRRRSVSPVEVVELYGLICLLSARVAALAEFVPVPQFRGWYGRWDAKLMLLSIAGFCVSFAAWGVQKWLRAA